MKDLRNSWPLYKENHKAFTKTVIFSLLAYMISTTIIFLISYSIENSNSPLSLIDFYCNYSNIYQHSLIFRVTFTLITAILLFAFLNCQYGLAYDIMSSGDMYAEFISAFSYFKRHWLHYISSMLIIVLPLIIAPLIFITFEDQSLREYITQSDENMVINIAGLILFVIFYIVWLITFLNLFPSVTSQGSLKHAIIESIRIVRSDFKRLLLTWFTYGFIVLFPIVIFGYIGVKFNPGGSLYLDIFIEIFRLIYLIYAFPMSVLIGTGIYNNVEFERFKKIEK